MTTREPVVHERAGPGSMGPVRWGVISTARIGWEKVIPAMIRSEWCEVRAVASRSLENAREWAGKFGIPVAYGSYDELLDDPEIEAVYNPTPNHLHVALTLAAARKGKHVLCEKPIAVDAREAETLRRAPEAPREIALPQWISTSSRARISRGPFAARPGSSSASRTRSGKRGWSTPCFDRRSPATGSGCDGRRRFGSRMKWE